MPMYLASKPNEPPIQYRHYRISISRVGKAGEHLSMRQMRRNL